MRPPRASRSQAGSPGAGGSWPDTLSIDVEDHFHLFVDEADTWGRYEVRVHKGTEKILSLLDDWKVRATFFVLGDAAARAPGVVREIASAGHEVATHGYSHQLVYKMGREGFSEDVRRSLDLLSELSDGTVAGFRASSFSVTPETPWFWEVLEENGIRYSSSLHPVDNFLYGKAVETSLEPHRVEGTRVVEIPIVPGEILGRRVPFSGGFFLRSYPAWLLRTLARQVRARGLPVHWYLHPWEMDGDQPRHSLPLHWRVLRYYRLGRAGAVLRTLLGTQVVPMGELAERVLAAEAVG